MVVFDDVSTGSAEAGVGVVAAVAVLIDASSAEAGVGDCCISGCCC